MTVSLAGMRIWLLNVNTIHRLIVALVDCHALKAITVTATNRLLRIIGREQSLDQFGYFMIGSRMKPDSDGFINTIPYFTSHGLFQPCRRGTD